MGGGRSIGNGIYVEAAPHLAPDGRSLHCSPDGGVDPIGVQAFTALKTGGE